MKITGSVSLVTGGAMGIGKEIVGTLLKKGAKFVSILDFNATAGSAAEEEFTKTYGEGKVKFFKCDVSSKEQMDDAFKKTQKIHNRLDIVCNNAGIDEQGDPERLVQINLIGTMNGTVLARDIMVKQTDPAGGVIVNVASMAGLVPASISPYYSASKHGVVGFTRSLAQDPLLQKANIRLNLICPTFVETSMLTRSRDGDPMLQAIMSRANIVPMSEVMTAFLMAVEDDSMQGQAIRVTPGCGVDLHPFISLEDILKLNIFKM